MTWSVPALFIFSTIFVSMIVLFYDAGMGRDGMVKHSIL